MMLHQEPALAETSAIQRSRLFDSPWLAVALVAVLCVNGISWGRTEIWNADQMALMDHFREGKLPFSPEHFEKPPLMGYMNFVFSVVPREILTVTVSLVTGSDQDGKFDYVSVWLAKILHVLLATGCVYLLFRLVVDFSGPRIASILALLFASSAGLVVQAHLITTDLPVVFFMMLALWASQRLYQHRRTRDYLFAGLCIGLTGAMKYNGLVVGLALPIYHLYGARESGWLKVAFDRRFLLGLLAVPAGFLIGNPFAAIEFDRFIADVNYVSTIAAAYVGARSEEAREANMIVSVATDHVGWPLFVVLMVGLGFGVHAFVTGGRSLRTATLASALGIGGFYTAYFMLQSNVMVRWILPLVPLLLIVSTQVWERLEVLRPKLLTYLSMVLLCYGVVCSVVVGLRFSGDPRMSAVRFVADKLPSGATIESTTYAPHWYRHYHTDVDGVRAPNVTGRHRVFEAVFRDRPDILSISRHRESDELSWYTSQGLNDRGPDYFATSSVYYERFLTNPVKKHYPEMQRFFSDLLDENLGYEKVFDQSSSQPNPLLYPKEILFLDNRLVILKKSPTSHVVRWSPP